jgi:hypothetical protein
LEDQHGREPDRNAKPRRGHETGHPEGHKGLELCIYHQEAHDEATQHLRTLYFELAEHPTVAFYNPNKFNQPSPAAKQAIRKLDELNNRLLNINCSSDIDIATGQIQWDRLVETWKSILFASKDTHVLAEEPQERYMSALANMCKEFHYPSEWANIPPGGLEEPDSKVSNR